MTAIRRAHRILVALATVTTLAVLVPTAAVAEQTTVGVSGAVNPDANGTPPGEATRRIVLGQDVVHNEHITTGPSGQTQIVFLDESALTVAPNADLTIDEFVYDPASGTGELAVRATQGVLRYVGGRISKQKPVTFYTPTGSIAVRGGVFVMSLSPTGKLDVIFLY